jgi:F0F1-type ATP synthase membrane subunit c/vacuolar-type H+-ATPase subunit K
MKRTVALGLLGLAAASSAFAQGNIAVGNYVSPYTSQVVWGANTGNSGPVAAVGPQFQVYFGEGVIADQSLLEAGVIIGIDDTKGYGGGGWTLFGVQVLPTWQLGDTFTFQLRTLPGMTPNGPIDTVLSRSVLWQENANIEPAANSPKFNEFGQGLTIYAVPEPTTFALAGLGAAALLIFRRRD